MKTTIFFYTGTGNSLWTARKLAGFLEPSELIPLSREKKQLNPLDADCAGLVFPVHIWGIPPPVLDFLQNWTIKPTQYIFALAVNAGQVAATLLQLQNVLSAKGLRLSSGFSIELPSNYIVWRGAVSSDQQQKKFTAALKKIESIAVIIRQKKQQPPEKGPFWQNPFFSWTYRQSFPHISKMDKSFNADEKCRACRICEKICPAHNILIVQGKPVWQHRCEQCFACIQWCPEEAIQYGKCTSSKKRYHHPDVSIKDMLDSVSLNHGFERQDIVK